MMLETIEDGFINTDTCRELEFKWDKKGHDHRLVCTFNDGLVKGYRIYLPEWEHFKATVAGYSPPIKAEPGYWRLRYWADTDEVERLPVLAWRLDLRHGYHQVVTPFSSGNPSEIDGDDSAVLCPGGRVVEPGNELWDDEAAWLRDMRERAEAKKKNVPPAA
jgi:hypothetical protein